MSVAADANAAETILYYYDVHGRLVQITHSGTINNGEQVVYTYDTAGNRVRKLTSGA